MHAQVIPAGAAGARCGDDLAGGTGTVWIHCRANGAAGACVAELTATDFPQVPPAAFVLHNVDDGNALFRDDFDPPGPRIGMRAAAAPDAAR